MASPRWMWSETDEEVRQVRSTIADVSNYIPDDRKKRKKGPSICLMLKYHQPMRLRNGGHMAVWTTPDTRPTGDLSLFPLTRDVSLGLTVAAIPLPSPEPEAAPQR